MIRYETAYRLHVESVFAHLEVRGIKPVSHPALDQRPSERFGTSTVVGAFLVLQGIFALAVADGAIRKNPTESPIVQVPVYLPSDVAVYRARQVINDSFTRMRADSASRVPEGPATREQEQPDGTETEQRPVPSP